MINDNFINIHKLSGNSLNTYFLIFAVRSNAANNLTKESAVRCISDTQICLEQESITVHEAETYLNPTSRSSHIWLNIHELLRTHTAYICVAVTSWWMMKHSQNGVLLLQLQSYLQKGAKCESAKYGPASSLGEFF